MRPMLPVALAVGVLLSGCADAAGPYGGSAYGGSYVPGYTYGGPGPVYGSPYLYGAPYGGAGRGVWLGQNWQQRQWSNSGASTSRYQPPPPVPATPPAPASPAQVQQNRKLLDQLGFQPNR